MSGLQAGGKKRDGLNLEELDLDRVLGGEPELQPSSGFTALVMERVMEAEAEAAAPNVPFPWRWVAPALAALVVALGAWGFVLLRPDVEIAVPPGMMQIGVGMLSLACSAVCVVLCRQWAMS